MNEIVLRLAHHTALLLESVCNGEIKEVHPTSAHFFNRMGSYIQFKESTADLDTVCAEINNTLNYFEKVFLLLLVQESLIKKHNDPSLNSNLQAIFECIGIDSALIPRFRGFFEQDDIYDINSGDYLLLSPQSTMDNEMLEGRWIEDNVPRGKEAAGIIVLDQVKKHLLVMFVEQIRSYAVRCINYEDKLFDQDHSDFCSFRLLKPGSELSIDGIPVLTFSELKTLFLQWNEKRELTMVIDELQYTNARGIKEIHSFSAAETTGRLIGIVGREGVGKSTLLNLLAGKFKPEGGSITINGYELWKYKYLLKGVIGFVPEEDLLFEELSVADNLSLTARLYYSSLSKKEIDARVNALLSRIDLLELKHVVVGNVDSKHIQPGQRRLINIALELLREPQILLVDNALSGLGMSDACKVIKVLHDYSFAGNLVITSISQVDSETFMLFDKIWILDEGGYPIYNGSVKSAPHYLFKNLKLTYHEQEKADPAQLLDWVNYRLPDKEAHVWKRVLEPQKWHDRYLRDQVLRNEKIGLNSLLPARILKIPNLEIQLLIFSIRNFKCKFSRANEILKALLIGPFFAFFIGLLLRSVGKEGYSFFTNDNIPLFQFVSVLVAIFLGLASSVDEIIRERNIIEKEEYQEFSRFSYLNSKILYLFPVIAIQVALYVLTACFILGIKEMLWIYWVVLFSSACFGALLGLVISSGYLSRSVIHKGVIPFILGLQLFLGGGIISYDKLNLGNHKYTPLIGDLMVARWGYEALAVEQFKNNSYEKLIYDTDKKLDQAGFYAFQVIPKLEQSLASCFTSSNSDSIRNNMALLQHEMERLGFEDVNTLPEILEKEEVAEKASTYLTHLSLHFYAQYDTLSRRKSLLMNRIADSLGQGNLSELKNDYHNRSLEETVTNTHIDQSYNIVDNEIICSTGIIYTDPRSDWGRASLFSPVKLFNAQVTETLWFNISMIWLLISFCYIWVLFDFTASIRRKK